MDRRTQAYRWAACALVASVLAAPALAVDGVIEINQARAVAGGVTLGDAPGFPVTISREGSYRLTGNLGVGDADSTAIQVTSGDVTIDLNGFEISCGTRVGPCEDGTGNGIDANQPNITVLNGTVRGMGNSGIVAGAGARIERVRAIANRENGIATGSGSSLSDNIASDNGNNGLGASFDSTLSRNTMRGNGRGGIETGSNCTITGNTANDNDVFGIYCNGGCTIQGNTTNNNSTGISLLGGNAVIGNTARSNTNFGLVAVGSDTGYTLNTFTLNNGGGDNAQVQGGTPLGANFCGATPGCP